MSAIGWDLVLCFLILLWQLSVKLKGKRMLRTVTMVTRRVELRSLGFDDSRMDKPIFRSGEIALNCFNIQRCHAVDDVMMM